MMIQNTRWKIVIIRTITAAIILTACSLLLAQGSGQADAFLNYGVGSRAMGMGRAFVSVSDDASGSYWNPAGMVGAKRFEITSMYTNLYYDSQFSLFGVVWPRPVVTPGNSFQRFFLGPSTAIGFNWIGLGMVNFHQTTETGIYLSDFSLGENAFSFSWAREEVGDWGVLRYGLTAKAVTQNFSGLVHSANMNEDDAGKDWSGGLDVGFTFQPIHMPGLNIVSLPYLMPLRFGINIVNVLRPGWTLSDGTNDLFPRYMRWGLSYRWNLMDWIPSTWDTWYQVLQNVQVLTVFDVESFHGPDNSLFFGVEGMIPVFRQRIVVNPRWGVNNQTEGHSLGFGLSTPFSKNAQVRLDYALNFHPYLPEDSRFFLTVKFGTEKGSSFFYNRTKEAIGNDSKVKKWLLSSIAEYPDNAVKDAAEALLVHPDTAYFKRYYALTSGQGKANWLLREAIVLLKQNQPEKAKKKGEDAAHEYAPLFIQPDNLLTDQELMDYGEALIIAGEWNNAITVLKESEKTSLKYNYLLATAYKKSNRENMAMLKYQEAVRKVETESDIQDILPISLLNLSELLMRKGEYSTALKWLNLLLDNHSGRLSHDYPRYPIIKDQYIVDDAQLLMGICEAMMGKSRKSIVHLLNVQRLYSSLDYGQSVEKDAPQLIQILKENDWEGLISLARTYFSQYKETH